MAGESQPRNSAARLSFVRRGRAQCCCILRGFWLSRVPAAAGAILCLLLMASTVEAGVEGRIAQTGFDSEAGPCYRRGSWCPVRIDLTLRGESAFRGTLRVIQSDADADRCISEREVALSGEGVTRSFWLYALPDPVRERPFEVQLVDETGSALMFDDGLGRSVPRLTAQASPMVIDQAEVLILDLSERPLSALGLSVRQENESFRRPLLLARTEPGNMPPVWLGLEMVDAAVWDAADPSKLDPSQVDALIAWVRSGGHLVLAASRTAGTLKQSRFEPLLPVEIGPVRQLKELPGVQSRLLGKRENEKLSEPMTVCDTALRPGADNRIGPTDHPFVSTIRLGRGRLTFVAAELRELFRNEDEPGRVVDAVFGFRRQPSDPDRTRMQIPLNLFAPVRQTVDFVKRTGAFMGVAILFAIGYALTATVVSWHWLKSRDWKEHNWSAFAAVVLAASGLSLAAVKAVRGVGTELHQLSVVDLDAGSLLAEATCLFGVKTGSHTRLDLWLPSDADRAASDQGAMCSLKPMPSEAGSSAFGGGSDETGFLSPLNYRMQPLRATLEDVPFRATLKQFLGHWSGERPESFLGEIYLDSGEIMDSSWIENRLGTALEGCYLFVARVDPKRDRSAGMIHAYELGTIGEGERIERLGSILSDRLAAANPKRRGDDEPIAQPKLDELQRRWVRDLSPSLVPGLLGQQERQIDPRNYDKALLLLTTWTEYDPTLVAVPLQAYELLAGHLRRLDLSGNLTRNRALLVGFTREPGPARLCVRPGGKKRRDFEPIEPSEARTMFRISLPVR